MTPRKAAVLAAQLPAGAQTWVSCGFDSAWTLAEHLTATVIDALNIGNWQRQGDRKAPRPTPLRRPAEHAAEQSKADRIRARAEAYAARQKQAQPVHRDSRGRFTKGA